ncbi:aminoglycoside phosphotransferase family protein [Thioclava sp. FR2]|uniref:aminoglycoside phosphotransferase family protein n=1 Tax=Thioclava sp. FR2 TaxID=3445780 RepID=UPI003EBB8B8E
MTDRNAEKQAFLAAIGWEKARRAFLAGDASDRSYDRLWRDGGSAVLMDAPPGKGDDPADFIRIADHLRQIGLSAPRILEADLGTGFLLIEDLGDALFYNVVQQSPKREGGLYLAATDVLLHLHRHEAPTGLADFRAQDWAEAAAFALDWYAKAVTGVVPEGRAEFVAELTRVMQAHADDPRVMILRDYHAQNLLDLPEREGVARVGLLDFQLAQMAQPGYDLVSLIQDARRDVSPEVTEAAIQKFAAERGASVADVAPSLAVLGAQRSLRILGVFARLCLVSGKPHYLTLVPRVWGQIQQNLAHPALRDLKAICDTALPLPTADALTRIKDQCAQSPL